MNYTPVISMIRNALAMSANIDQMYVVPQILIDVPRLTAINNLVSADIALGFLSNYGVRGGRVRMNLRGYPGILRELAQPPPWIKLEPEDCLGSISEERKQELQSLVYWVDRYGHQHLRDEHERWLDELERASIWDAVIFEDTDFAYRAPSRRCDRLRDSRRESFDDLLTLARLFGSEVFDCLFEAVFSYDEFTVAPGVPDLLIWVPHETAPLWLLAEVKAHGDYMSHEQKAWLCDHWNRIRGHYAIIAID